MTIPGASAQLSKTIVPRNQYRRFESPLRSFAGVPPGDRAESIASISSDIASATIGREEAAIATSLPGVFPGGGTRAGKAA